MPHFAHERAAKFVRYSNVQSCIVQYSTWPRIPKDSGEENDYFLQGIIFCPSSVAKLYPAPSMLTPSCSCFNSRPGDATFVLSYLTPIAILTYISDFRRGERYIFFYLPLGITSVPSCSGGETNPMPLFLASS